MRNIRTKKMKRQTHHSNASPFDDSIIQLQLDKNQKCMHQISKNHFDKAAQYLKQIKSDEFMISVYNRHKITLKSMNLNTEAYLYQRQNLYQMALKCIKEAEVLQDMLPNMNSIQNVRTRLNKSVVLGHIGKHQQSIKLIKNSIQMLRKIKTQNYFLEYSKNSYKMLELVTLQFCNIITELGSMTITEKFIKIYKEGRNLAELILGNNHKLTILLQNLCKEKSKCIIRSQSPSQTLKDFKSVSSYSHHKIKSQVIPLNCKERELKKIYNKHKLNLAGNIDKISQNDKDYLISVEKIKHLYRKKEYNLSDQFNLIKIIENKQTELPLHLAKRINTEPSYQHHQNHAYRIKDIILNGKTINKQMIYPLRNTDNQQKIQIASLKYPKQNYQSQPQPQAISKSNKIELQQPLQSLIPQITLPIVSKLQAHVQKQQNCQLI